jgi:hypothetical protein
MSADVVLAMVEMRMITYQQAREDFEYLETIAELDDQVELDAEREELMRNPTKAFAAKLYGKAVQLWFQEHPTFSSARRVAEIRSRHGAYR